MARPIKDDGGLLFFSVDINIEDDPAIEYLLAKYTCIGFALYIRLLIRIYRLGYYKPWTEREERIFTSRVGIDYKEVKEIVNEFLIENLFSSDLYGEYKLLTSKRVQRQYITAHSRRSKIILHKELNLLDDDDELLNASKNKCLSHPNLIIKSFRNYCKNKRDIINNNLPAGEVSVNNNPPSEEVIVNNNTLSEGVSVNNNPPAGEVSVNNNTLSEEVIVTDKASSKIIYSSDIYSCTFINSFVREK